MTSYGGNSKSRSNGFSAAADDAIEIQEREREIFFSLEALLEFIQLRLPVNFRDQIKLLKIKKINKNSLTIVKKNKIWVDEFSLQITRKRVCLNVVTDKTILKNNGPAKCTGGGVFHHSKRQTDFNHQLHRLSPSPSQVYARIFCAQIQQLYIYGCSVRISSLDLYSSLYSNGGPDAALVAAFAEFPAIAAALASIPPYPGRNLAIAVEAGFFAEIAVVAAAAAAAAEEL